jgi:hypothetical protein
MSEQPVQDRGAAQTAAGTSAQSMRTVRSAAIIGGIAVACGAGLYFARGALAPTAKAPDARKQVRANVAYDPLPSLNTVGVPTPAASPVAPAQVAVIPAPVEDQVLVAAQRAPLTAFSGSFPRTAEEERATQLQARETEDRGGFERRFTPSRFDVAKAGHIGDRRFIVRAGNCDAE